MQHLDHRLTPQQRLLAAVHRAEPALADPRAQYELAQLAAGEILDLWHPPHPTTDDAPRLGKRHWS